MKIAACLVVRDEEDAVAQWLVYYHLLAFDALIVIDHNSSDRTAQRALEVGRTMDVRLVKVDAASAQLQAELYLRVCQQGGAEFDWIAFFDADEYLVGPAGRMPRDFLAARADAAAIVIPWMMFGSSGHVEKPGGLIIEDYCRRSSYDFPANLHVKSIVRPAKVAECLNPHCFRVAGHTRLPDGEPAVWGSPGKLLRYPEQASWRLHHYFTRSASHWTDRLARGQISKIVRTAEDFDRYDRNEVFDDSACRYAPAVRGELKRIAGTSVR